MQRDILAGRPSNLEAQSGAVARLATRVGVAALVHDFIYPSLLPFGLRARGRCASRRPVTSSCHGRCLNTAAPP
jgi:2-dehydropantoate 2-reductase